MIATAQRPFVRAFAHEGRWYAYDVGTNELLEVDAALGSTLVALASDRPVREVAHLARKIGREAVGGALAEIEAARRDDGLFLCRRPDIAPHRLVDADQASYASRLSHLILSVTEDCNLACRYCPQAAERGRPGARRPRAMPREIALRALAFFAGHSRETARPAVSFYGGEPLLRPDLLREVIHTARAHSDWPEFRFFVTTNGTLIDEAAVDLIVREELHLQVSLDGPSRTHDRWRAFRDGRGSHAAVMAGLERVLRRDPGAAERIFFQVTAAPPVDFDVIGEWFDGFALYRNLGIERGPRLRISQANLSWRDGRPADEAATPSRIARVRARWLDACAGGRREDLDPVACGLFDPEAIRFYHRSRARMPAAITPGGCCLPGVRRLSVTPDGRFEACERAASALEIGNAQEGIKGERVAALMESYDRAVGHRCRDCWAVRLCGLCYASLSRAEGAGALVMSEERCRNARIEASSMLRLYAGLLSRGEVAADFLRNSRIA